MCIQIELYIHIYIKKMCTTFRNENLASVGTAIVGYSGRKSGVVKQVFRRAPVERVNGKLCSLFPPVMLRVTHDSSLSVKTG